MKNRYTSAEDRIIIANKGRTSRYISELIKIQTGIERTSKSVYDRRRRLLRMEATKQLFEVHRHEGTTAVNVNGPVIEWSNEWPLLSSRNNKDFTGRLAAYHDRKEKRSDRKLKVALMVLSVLIVAFLILSLILIITH